MRLAKTLIILCLLFAIACQKELIGDAIVQVAAQGSLKDTAGNCFFDSAFGTFYHSVQPSADTNYVEVRLVVTKTGSYNISTNNQNGFGFHDSGYFNKTGDTIIRLKPAGIPIDTGLYIFSLSFDNDVCDFSIFVHDSSTLHNPISTDTTITSIPDSNGINRWQFTTDDGTFLGSFVTAKLITSNGLTSLSLTGKTYATQDSTLLLNINFPGTTIQPGTYLTQGPGNSNASFKFSDKNNSLIYYAVKGNNAESLVTIVIVSFDPATNIVEGLFAGKANNKNDNDIIPVTGGAFEVTVSN